MGQPLRGPTRIDLRQTVDSRETPDDHESFAPVHVAPRLRGGIRARPGEVSLAHHGVLFLDELPEFPAQVLDSLRQPLEDGSVVISRANRHVRYPARFQLVAAMNPCRCGGGPGDGACRRGPACARTYQARISGPFFDRIDRPN